MKKRFEWFILVIVDWLLVFRGEWLTAVCSTKPDLMVLLACRSLLVSEVRCPDGELNRSVCAATHGCICGVCCYASILYLLDAHK